MPKKRAAQNASSPSPVTSKRPRRTATLPKEKEKLKFELEWNSVGKLSSQGLPPLLKLTGPAVKGSAKVAAFDLDYTWIRPASGRKWPTGPKDWMFLSDEIPKKLKAIYDEGFKVVIFTNQRGMEKGHTTPKAFMEKIEDIITALDFPIEVFVSTGETHFRKPGVLMWEHMEKLHNDGISVNNKESYYVGDAAGRAKHWAPDKPRDFSCSDRMFAANAAINFYTPEEYFDGEEAVTFDWRSVSPEEILETTKSNKLEDAYHTETKDLVLLVGSPASGKSTFYRRFLEPSGYVWINRDTLKTPAKCKEAVKQAIKEGKSVAVDNTNPTAAGRATYIDLAEKKGYTIRCIVMDTPRELCLHLNMVRQNQSDGKIRRIPGVGFNVFRKHYQEPTLDEGFSEIKKVPFYPVFKSKKDERLFQQWTD